MYSKFKNVEIKKPVLHELKFSPMQNKQKPLNPLKGNNFKTTCAFIFFLITDFGF